MSKFAVYHVYNYVIDEMTDGDTYIQEDLICVFDSEDEAKEFKTKYEKLHKYEHYKCGFKLEKLDCGKIEIRELPTSYDEKEFWWLFK